VPNACNDCHTTKSPDWAAAAVEQWHGPVRKGFQNFAAAFHAAWTGQADAATLLAAVAAERETPAFVRASALAELAQYVAPANIDLARKGLADADPMVRIGALDMLADVPIDRVWPIASPRLADENRGVRIRAAFLLAGVRTAGLPAADRERFEGAAADFVAAQRLNADRPEARDALGTFLKRRGLLTDSEAEYKAALRLSPHYATAAINLADLYRQLGRNAEGENVLRTAASHAPSDAGVHHALGLTLVRLQRPGEALLELRRAADLAPEQPRYAYVYAVGLHSAGRGSDAIAVLKESLARHPANRDLLVAAAAFSRDTGDPEGALEYAERLLQLVPGDRELQQFIEVLRRDVKRSGR
jgi:Flp pilus assembly protein TadD